MTTITNNLPVLLRLVTRINQTVAHGYRGTHRARLAGTVGTSNTVLVARSAQSHPGKHRLVRAA